MKYCVLIVDDQPDSIKILEVVLDRRGFQYVTAENSIRAEEKLKEHLPHLLVVDITLGPNDSGLDWLKGVRQGPFRQIPVIMQTGSSDANAVKESAAIGVDNYIVKPSSQAILSKKILDIQKKLQKQSCGYFINSSQSPIKANMNLKNRGKASQEQTEAAQKNGASPSPIEIHYLDEGKITFAAPDSLGKDACVTIDVADFTVQAVIQTVNQPSNAKGPRTFEATIPTIDEATQRQLRKYVFQLSNAAEMLVKEKAA